MKANWTSKALIRLEQIHDYIALDNPAAARDLVNKLTKQVAVIATQPQAGAKVQEYNRDDIREVYCGRYRVIYLILDRRIDVLTVRHGMRLLPNSLRNL